jgi:hypothetical protein
MLNRSEEFREGYHAYLDDVPRSDNPYNGSDQDQEHEDWDDGWHEAAWDD